MCYCLHVVNIQNDAVYLDDVLFCYLIDKFIM